MAKNANCAVTDSVLCKWIDKDCSVCAINGMKRDADAKQALEDFEVTMSLLPEDLDSLQGEECQFCKHDPNKRARYALIDLAHSEPASETGLFFGLGKKVRRKVGSLIPLSISICRECRRNFYMLEVIKWAVTALFLAVSIAIVSIPSIVGGLGQSTALLIVLAATAAGYFAGRAAAGAYVKAKKEKTRFNVFEIPVCSRMQSAGWFTLQDNTPVTRFLFSRRSHTKKMEGVRGSGQQEV